MPIRAAHAVALVLTWIALSPAALPAHPARTSYRFAFGSETVKAGHIQVSPSTVYSRELGYGFDLGSSVSCTDARGSEALPHSCCTSDKPFFFSVLLPEGNYTVTVTLGDPMGESATTIKAELRRLMLESVRTARGRFERRTFTVNIRTPKIAGDGEVRLKEREKTTEIAAWDDKLTLEFNNARPCISELEVAPAPDAVTVYLLGDSTVCDQPSEPWNSWGQMLPRFFKPGIAVANHAESGESLRSSLAAGRLDKVLSSMKAGDYLFLQYGHNDMKEKGEGIGAFTSYKSDLERFVEEARKRGGIPVVVTSMHRRTFDSDGRIANSLGDYPEAVRRVALEANVPLIDLNAMSKLFYEALGPENTKHAFVDNTHHNNYGSYELARCIVEGIKANRLGIARFLADEAQATFDPAHPDPVESFSVPPSPRAATAKPDGN